MRMLHARAAAVLRIALGAALLAGCGHPADVDDDDDATCEDGGGGDAGTQRDAGGPEADAGPRRDGGSGGGDAGPADDGGPGGQDAGPRPDGGPGGQDAGPRADGGPGGYDAGPKPDGGSGGQDAGPGPDAGLPDAGPPVTVTETSCDVLVAGGGLGGVAAAHEAASSGVGTCLVEATDWLGGQATSQGVSALDEGFIDGYYGFSRTYADFRQRIRQHYLSRGTVTNRANEGAEPGAFDPGSCWVSRLCFEPAVAVDVLENQLLGPLRQQNRLRVWKGFAPTRVVKAGAAVERVEFADAPGNRLVVHAKVTIDATELGDLLPLAGAGYRTGREAASDTGEPSALQVAAPECVQPFTYTFALERMASGDYTIARPAGYDPSLFDLATWKVFPAGGAAAFWDYRRLLSASNFASGVPRDVAMINWGNPGGNDYNVGVGPDGANVIDKDPATAARIHRAGREHALKFLYYLQHDVPRDDGTGRGYPNLKPRADVMGTADGLSKHPYIREARRLRALTLVREQDVTGPATERGTLYDDTVGIGHYNVDIHPCALGEPPVNGSARALEVPLGALVPQSVDGLLAGAKNIGTTHITNGAYRVHPVEWTIGQAAGAVAARSVHTGWQPRRIRSDRVALRRVQHALVAGRGGPLFWWSDVAQSDPAYVAAQMVGAAGVMIGAPGDLAFRPAEEMTRAMGAAVTVREMGLAQVTACRPTFCDVPCSHWAYGAVQAMADAQVTSGVGAVQCPGGGTGPGYGPDLPLKRAQLATLLVRAAGWPTIRPATPTYADVPGTHGLYDFVETAADTGLFDGEADGRTFAPDDAVTRRSAALWIYNHMKWNYGF